MIRIVDFFNLILDFGDEWVVDSVETDHKGKEVILELKYETGGYYEDPETMVPVKLYDHSKMRKWRHIDILEYKCYVKGRVPRIKCADGKVKQVALNWADNFGRHTYHFETKAIKLLQATKNQTKTAEFLNCGFRLVNRVMHACTVRGMARRNLDKMTFEHVGLDEKAFKSGHNYVTVLTHSQTGVVLDVCEGRDEVSVNCLLTEIFTKKQRHSMKTVSMDMWKSYMNSVEKNFQNAEIVHDRYHLITYLNKSIDQVRRRETKDNPELKGSRYALLKNQCNLTTKQKNKFEQIKHANYEVSKAWQVKENFKELFGLTNNDKDAWELLEMWAQDSYKQCLREVNSVVKTFANHTRGIVNALICDISNAMAERLNGKIQEIKLIGRGYNTFENFRSAILFFNGGLDLFPCRW
jgi:transposase